MVTGSRNKSGDVRWAELDLVFAGMEVPPRQWRRLKAFGRTSTLSALARLTGAIHQKGKKNSFVFYSINYNITTQSQNWI